MGGDLSNGSGQQSSDQRSAISNEEEFIFLDLNADR
jgi:hypothetical protein